MDRRLYLYGWWLFWNVHHKCLWILYHFGIIFRVYFWYCLLVFFLWWCERRRLNILAISQAYLGCRFISLTFSVWISNHCNFAVLTSFLTRFRPAVKSNLFGLEGLAKNWHWVVLRMETRGRSISDDRVNHGGLLGRMYLRVFFTASEILVARLIYDSCLLNSDQTSEVNSILFPFPSLWRLSQLISISCWLVNLSVFLFNSITIKSNEYTSMITINLRFIYAWITDIFHIFLLYKYKICSI